MSLLRNILLVAAGLLTGAGPVAGEVLQVAGGGDVKPADPGYEYNRSVFDCTPRQILTLSVGQASSLVDDTTGGSDLINGYPCRPWSETGPEHIYRLDVAEGDTLEFWAGLTNLDTRIDHDLFLLNGCDTDSCLIGENTELTATLTGGSYYLIIDGATVAALDQGPYTLDYACRFPGVAPLACLPGMATEVDMGLPTSIYEGNLFGQFDFVRSFACSPLLLKGGEKWFSLTLPGATDNQFGGKNFSSFKIEFTVLAPTLDVALWLFDGCGISPTCVDFANDGTGGRGETMQYRNETDQPVTLFLGVDCFRPPAETGTGFFTVKISSDMVVRTEETSFGSLRALYR